MGLTGQPAWPTGEILVSDEVLSKTKQVAAPEEHHLKCSGLMVHVCTETQKEIVTQPEDVKTVSLKDSG